MGMFPTTFNPTNSGNPTVVSADTTSLPASSTALVPVKTQRRYRARGRRFRRGISASSLRATTAARMLLRGDFGSLVEAADGCGSCPQYVAAALVLLQSGDAALLKDVLAGRVPLREAAKRERNVVQLQLAFRRASTNERARFGRREGVGVLWDACIAPAI